MSLTTGVILIVVACVFNLVWLMIEKHLDAKPPIPALHPDNGVDEVSLKAAKDVPNAFGVPSGVPLQTAMPMPRDVRAFFDLYENLQIDHVLHLSRSCLEEPYGEKAAFIKIGSMSEEDDLLVKKSESDAGIYIACSEDGNPEIPELFATSFTNLLAIAWHDYKRLEDETAPDKGSGRRGLSGGRTFNSFMASLSGLIVLCVDIVPLSASAWFLFRCISSPDFQGNYRMIALGATSTIVFSGIAILALRNIIHA